MLLPYLGLQSKFITKQLKSCMTGLFALTSQRLRTRLTAGTVMTFTLVEQSVDYMTVKLNISKHGELSTSAIADHITSLGHNIKVMRPI